MAIEATSAQRPPGEDSDPSTQRRRRRPRWRLVLLAAVATIVAAAAVVVIQLLPNPADGPGGRRHPGDAARQLLPPAGHPDQAGPDRHLGGWRPWHDPQRQGHRLGSGDQASGTFQETFTTPGSYRYSCTLHLGMNGRVDVVAGAHHDGRPDPSWRPRADHRVPSNKPTWRGWPGSGCPAGRTQAQEGTGC
jgi:hypothetical protein